METETVEDPGYNTNGRSEEEVKLNQRNNARFTLRTTPHILLMMDRRARHLGLRSRNDYLNQLVALDFEEATLSQELEGDADIWIDRKERIRQLRKTVARRRNKDEQLEFQKEETEVQPSRIEKASKQTAPFENEDWTEIQARLKKMGAR